MNRVWLRGGIAGLLGWGSGIAQAGRPLTVDDADPADPGVIELEAGAAVEDDPGYTHTDLPFGVAYGLASGWEVGLGFGGQFETRRVLAADSFAERTERVHGLGDLYVGLKNQVRPAGPFGTRHALAPAVKFPTADDEDDLGSGETDYDLTWLVSRSLGETAGLHFNAGYTWLGGPDPDAAHGGGALDLQPCDTLQWVAEVSGEQAVDAGTDLIVQYRIGVRWSPRENLVLDMAGGSKIAGDAPDFIFTAGLTWTLGGSASPDR